MKWKNLILVLVLIAVAIVCQHTFADVFTTTQGVALAMSGFGVPFKAASRAQLRAKSTAPSGASPEAIWHMFYDTQEYVTAVTTRLTFFQVTNVDRTITNMPSAGQLPDPQWLSIYNITCDFLTQNSSNAAGILGELNDIALLMKVGRAIWTLHLSDKAYGPYPLTVLHGTGGPSGNVDAGTLAVGIQQANNMPTPGWNYNGSLIIPPKTNFDIEVQWAAAQATTATPIKIRLGIMGILSRRVL